ncbi:hypothetical protein E3N88_31900 [Mikania micrantha]|uniref:Pre-PUA domain-containing protein n=1 Tax=Mikania micrantha TaxID=192012 RepID=A0A5N6M852_9ASTR|nr:hypothetical protein E3N88_31900 [Mikania micrantha]
MVRRLQSTAIVILTIQSSRLHRMRIGDFNLGLIRFPVTWNIEFRLQFQSILGQSGTQLTLRFSVRELKIDLSNSKINDDLKSLEAKPQQRLSGADRKKLKRTIKERFPNASDTDLDFLIPPKCSNHSFIGGVVVAEGVEGGSIAEDVEVKVEEVSEMVGDGMSDMSGGGRRLAVVDGGGRESPSGLWSFLKVIPSKG